MRGESDADDVRQVIRQRADVLSTLLDRGYTKRELTTRLDVSRSTVDRAVRQLEANHLVTRTDGAVCLTRAGRLSYDAFAAYCDQITRVAAHGDILAELPPSAGVGQALLDGATVYRSDPPATGRPTNEVTALIARGTAMRACVTVINDAATADECYRMVTERGGEGCVVYTSALADHIRDDYFAHHHEMVETGGFSAYETESLPFDLFVVDTDDGVEVAVLVYGDTGMVRGAIHNDTDAAVAWGERTFERLRASATEFTDEFRVGSGEGAESVTGE